jgi:hypothetical protein
VRSNQVVVGGNPSLQSIAERGQHKSLSLHRPSGDDDRRCRIDVPDSLCVDAHDRAQRSAYDDESATSSGVTPGHHDAHEGLIDRDGPKAVISARIRSFDSAPRSAMEQRGDQQLSTRWVG